MEFSKVPIPTTRAKRGRPALVNPWVEQFPTDEAVQCVVLAPEDSTEVRRLVRQARQAARDLNLRSFVHTSEFDDEADGDTVRCTRVIAWTQPKDDPAP